MDIKVADLPLLLLAYFGTVASYFLGIYLFDESQFFHLETWNNILLSVSYSFPVIFCNLFIAKFMWEISGWGKLFEKDFISDIMNIFLYSAYQQYVVLIYCLIFFGDNPLFRFYHFRNNTWIESLSGLVFLGIILLLKRKGRIPAFPSKKGNGSAIEGKDKN